jgi:hypothetical protein
MLFRFTVALALVLGTLAPAAAQPGLSPMDLSNPAKSNQAPDLKPPPVPPLVTPLEKLPIERLTLPPGFTAEVWSWGHPGGRTMVMGDRGTLFMGSRLIGRVYAITDIGGKRVVKTLLSACVFILPHIPMENSGASFFVSSSASDA